MAFSFSTFIRSFQAFVSRCLPFVGWAFFCAVAQAQDAEDLSDEAKDPLSVTFTSSDLPWIILIVVVFSVVVYILYRKLVAGYGQQTAGIADEEAKFEKALVERAHEEEDTDPLPGFAPVVARAKTGGPWVDPAGTPAVSPEQAGDGSGPTAASTGEVASQAAEEPGEAAVLALGRRMQQLNIFLDREGQFKLSGSPDAPIYRMKRGGFAVILPRLESAAVLTHCSKRFDLVMVVVEGEVLVFSRLQNRLVELIDRPGDFDPARLTTG